MFAAELTLVPLAFAVKVFGRAACDLRHRQLACCGLAIQAAGGSPEACTAAAAGLPNPYAAPGRAALAGLLCGWPCDASLGVQMAYLVRAGHPWRIGLAVWRAVPDYRSVVWVTGRPAWAVGRAGGMCRGPPATRGRVQRAQLLSAALCGWPGSRAAVHPTLDPQHTHFHASVFSWIALYCLDLAALLLALLLPRLYLRPVVRHSLVRRRPSPARVDCGMAATAGPACRHTLLVGLRVFHRMTRRRQQPRWA